MEEMKNLVPVVFANQRVLTNNQIADFYGVEARHIRDNFRHNRKRFIEGVEYFKLEGDELQSLKDKIEVEIMSASVAENFRSQGGYKSPLAGATRSLVLYTKQGAARHCKMLNNPNALNIFMQLQRDYFNVSPQAVTAPALQPVEVRGVRGYVDAEKVAWLNAEDVSRGLGLVEAGKFSTSGENYVRWERVNSYLAEFGYDKQVGKGDYLPENMVYRLAMKANNETAQKFQAKIADEIMPSLRRYGFYSESIAVDAVDIREAQLKLLNMPSHIKPDSQLADKLLEIAKLMQLSDARDKILIHAANLLVGKEIF